MQDTPISERKRITFIGRRNAGKSSLINAITSQQVSIVSEIPGTTTDPVNKTMEFFPLGPVIITDTAGIDDIGELGELRIKRTNDILAKTDIAVIVIPSDQNDLSIEKQLKDDLSSKNILYIVCMSKSDLYPDNQCRIAAEMKTDVCSVSSLTGNGIEDIRNLIARTGASLEKPRTILDGLCFAGSRILMVTPIDQSAPVGRMILPQVMTLRDCMDKHGICMCVQPDELEEAALLFKPDLCITDSQAFEQISRTLSPDQKLTGFSILMARAKGDLSLFYRGAQAVDDLKDGNRILIAEACTHHVQKNDIGTSLIPDKLSEYTKKHLVFEKTAGEAFPEDPEGYSLIIHCGGCMLTPAAMHYRQITAAKAQIPMTNYGIILAKLSGILDRAAKWLI